MKMFFVVLAVLSLASLGFASTCEESCCDSAGGVWDGSYCEGGGTDYDDCAYYCESAAPYETYYDTSGCCCSTAFILLLVGGAAVVNERRRG